MQKKSSLDYDIIRVLSVFVFYSPTFDSRSTFFEIGVLQLYITNQIRVLNKKKIIQK